MNKKCYTLFFDSSHGWSVVVVDFKQVCIQTGPCMYGPQVQIFTLKMCTLKKNKNPSKFNWQFKMKMC